MIIYAKSQFVKRIFEKISKNLSDHKIYLGFAQKRNDQTMGQTYDLGTGIAETTIHAIAVGTVSPGDGDLAVPDGDDVGTGLVSNGEFLIDAQIQGADHTAVGGDLSHSGRGRSGHEKQAQSDASNDQTKKQDGPIF